MLFEFWQIFCLTHKSCRDHSIMCREIICNLCITQYNTLITIHSTHVIPTTRTWCTTYKGDRTFYLTTYNQRHFTPRLLTTGHFTTRVRQFTYEIRNLADTVKQLQRKVRHLTTEVRHLTNGKIGRTTFNHRGTTFNHKYDF